MRTKASGFIQLHSNRLSSSPERPLCTIVLPSVVALRFETEDSPSRVEKGFGYMVLITVRMSVATWARTVMSRKLWFAFWSYLHNIWSLCFERKCMRM
jgi:hypothetical protein